ncbi:MAG TPA: response regulator, partial [Flavobacteriales bacterium]|nr:response regulator [Flavobacteriales bacterium]
MKTILLIEDDADMRENTAEILELANYRVVKAENGRRGVEAARKEMPDLVLCDLRMPGMDGLQ